MNNISLNTSDLTSDSMTLLLQFSLWPIRIICPLLIILCPVANWICISTFQSRIYSRSSSKWYFIFIAIFDTIYVLITAPLIFLITFEIYILNWNIILCKLIVFLNYLSCQISAGLLACLSIDRLIATTCLYLYRYNCTTNISKYVCILVILILSLINSHYLIGYTIDQNGYCSARYYKWYENIYSHLNIVYLLSYSIIPFTIITICNVFIVISVYQNKANMKRKYLLKKPILSLNNQNDQTIINSSPYCLPTTLDRKEDTIMNNNNKFQQSSNQNKRQVFVTMNENETVNKLIDADNECRTERYNRFSQNLLLDGEELVSPIETPPKRQNSSISAVFRKRSSTSTTYSQKMCVQVQITLSLLAISISFIFCTLPNCISTIMIQTYNQNEQVRKFWQAMNYFSIVPLLITHSVNLIFYYLSSHMFRTRVKENYFKKTRLTSHFSLRSLFKS
ncbi:unnamed protein product [Adineta steineri]|uniref:G-protein coupled receptors family 1 profile domain-containing protein n=1 Tax=Adineta steineri TaxID=433720 RepID=A0A819K719_9BILA|nr:unnamed protein product [Adineta steineri]CAF3944763.1 unnamed protein product [Adineta steineri]